MNGYIQPFRTYKVKTSERDHFQTFLKIFLEHLKKSFAFKLNPLIFVERTKCTLPDFRSTLQQDRKRCTVRALARTQVHIIKLDMNHRICCSDYGTWEKSLVELTIIEQSGTWALCMINNCSFDKKALLVQWLPRVIA
jgi:hypothetical protein